MKKYLKEIGIFILIFCISFLLIYFFGHIFVYPDSINTYGFSYAIFKGQVPYLDFNMITTPLYAFYQSLFLHIYNDVLMIMISQTLLITINFILLYKLFQNKAFLFLLLSVVVRCSNVALTYNYMCLFMMTLLVYLENKYSDKDFLIGFVLGLEILSKHTLGCFLIIPSIVLYYNNKQKLLKRFIGLLFPCGIFLIYLVLNGALYQFIDLCFLGLFDFADMNGVGGGNINYLLISILLITFFITLCILIKHKKDIIVLYFMFGIMFCIPIIDSYHIIFWLNCFLYIVLNYIKFDYSLVKIALIFVSTFCFIFYCFTYYELYKRQDFYFTKKLNHFRYDYTSEEVYIRDVKANEYIQSFEEPIVLTGLSIKYVIINDRELTYFDTFLEGNFGYNGNQKMIDRVDDLHDQIFIIAENERYSKNKSDQFPNDIADYIIKNSTKIDSKYNFSVYYKE